MKIAALTVCCTALWLWCWSLTRQLRNLQMQIRELKKYIGQETRCHICTEKNDCPAYCTGVAYPCAYFKEGKHGTEE